MLRRQPAFLCAVWIVPASSHSPQTMLGDSKLAVDVRVCGCLCLCVSSLMDWRPVQGVTCLGPYDSWDNIHDPNLDKRLRKWTDGAQRGKKHAVKPRLTSWSFHSQCKVFIFSQLACCVVVVFNL